LGTKPLPRNYFDAARRLVEARAIGRLNGMEIADDGAAAWMNLTPGSSDKQP
jgi:hypothetical protein